MIITFGAILITGFVVWFYFLYVYFALGWKKSVQIKLKRYCVRSSLLGLPLENSRRIKTKPRRVNLVAARGKLSV